MKKFLLIIGIIGLIVSGIFLLFNLLKEVEEEEQSLFIGAINGPLRKGVKFNEK